LGLDAVKELKKANPSLEFGDFFSEIMLYSFLESSSNAPKILSKIKLNRLSGTFSSASSGVHLLASNDLSLKNHQLAFGASHVLNDIYSAIDNAFTQVVNIKNNISDEISLVETSLFDNTFDDDTTAFLRDTLIPKKSRTSKPDNSFGIFLGYSISLDKTDEIDNFLKCDLLLSNCILK